MESITLEHSDFGPAERHYHVLPKQDNPAPIKKGIQGWRILAGIAGLVILAVAIAEWVKYNKKREEKEHNFQ